jgi:hypothetical protein
VGAATSGAAGLDPLCSFVHVCAKSMGPSLRYLELARVGEASADRMQLPLRTKTTSMSVASKSATLGLSVQCSPRMWV